MRKNETHVERLRQAQLADDRNEVVAVRAQPVQPDDGSGRIAACCDLDGL
jgi:hypothetical protein